MSIAHSRLAPYRIKMEALNVGERLFIPKDAFSKWPPNQKERPVSNGPKVWVMTAHGERMEVRRIE